MIISLSENKKVWNQSKSKCWNCISKAVIFLQFCQQAMERRFLNLSSVFFGKGLHLKVCLAILPFNPRPTASSKNNYSININWLSLAFLASIWKIDLDIHLKAVIHWKLFVLLANMSAQLDGLLCEIIHDENSWLKLCIYKISHQLFNLNLQIWQKIVKRGLLYRLFSKRLSSFG